MFSPVGRRARIEMSSVGRLVNRCGRGRVPTCDALRPSADGDWVAHRSRRLVTDATTSEVWLLQ